ncbi:peptidase M15 [Burkholderia sp. MSMB0856]|uniref:D-Ala-D-Ala carboxypeptidase family metallohydrolase n=1 Tax=Burkholderia sp. MSMB0856 TaxID=1637869 RepID=UPI00075383EC|nr:D-Ala-D-Ala carboxypeptidase family metallohydrolase [Burkholderia sp. MSMB0856]AOJ86743.1 peptidase M15 [Burkholderia sp. MSMB0856]KVH38083.1 peptidase M15 [Burkholderia sp. MSMB0856]
MKLTDHFALSELTQSETATRRGIGNSPPLTIVENLKRTAQTLEKVRTLLGAKPILVSSGYRSPALNKAVGGAANSAHVQGLAADFICPGFGSPLEICKRLVEARVEFDQLIQEGTWVHIGLAPAGQRPRRQVLTAHFGGGATRYSTGLPA